jgi:alpha-beta hydrolase superfamily lysophospholipase
MRIALVFFGSVGIIGWQTDPREPVQPIRACDPEVFLSHDPAVAEACRGDPLCCGDKVSARLGYESIRPLPETPISSVSWTCRFSIRRGDADRLVLGAELLSRKFRMKDRTIRMCPGLYHEVYNERADLRDLVSWLNSHI